MSKLIDKRSLQNEQDLPLLPLKDIVVFPHMIVPVFINEDLCINAVEKAYSADRKIFLSAFKVSGVEGVGLSCKLEPPFDVYDVGTVCSIMRTRKLPDGRMKVLVQGLYKAEVVRLGEIGTFPAVAVAPLTENLMPENSAETEALIRVVRECIEKIVALGKSLPPDIVMILEDVTEPGRIADLVAANLGLKVFEAQSILAVSNPLDRLKAVHRYLAREIEVYQMQVRVQSQAKEEIGKMQREHYLREQIRALKNELGDGDPKDELEGLWKQAEALPLPQDAKEEVQRQLRRLERMHQDSSEATLTRTHVECLLNLPWGKSTADALELAFVKKVLDEDHFGLEQIKDRIMEYLAVKKLNPTARSPIVCFVGPPGVGKTSLGKSIAKSMGRKFARISLGGVRDEAEIRGHRKTYVGAYPGRIIQAIKQVQAANPVLMLDEIDKLAHDHRGDPSSALLEVLDPEQNREFVDHYLGVSFDLSNVVFLANANTLDTIPPPLRDRLEVIEIDGYTEEEKLTIANQYLIPKQLHDAGLSDQDVVFSRNSVSAIINNYTRESGLRTLDKRIAAICRKIARQHAEEAEREGSSKISKIKLTPAHIQRHLGAERYRQGQIATTPQIGSAVGLAYTQYGGEVLVVETNLLPSRRANLVLTGQLGEVMRESAQTALSYIRSKAGHFGIELAQLAENEIHVHFPAGATPKDGPSAGITIATSIISALLKRPPLGSIAMTGEISLHGNVLPIGGLKEKLLAAQREGISTVVVPEKNRAVFDELPQNIKRRLKVHFAVHYEEVFEHLFGGVTPLNLISPTALHEKLAS